MTIPQARIREGTALRRRGKVRVQKILSAARNIFLSDGYAALSMRKVAAAAGISLGNLGYYFGSKSDLFESMIDDVLAGYRKRWDQISTEHAEDATEQLDRYLDFHYDDCQRSDTQQFFYQFWAVSSHDDFVAQARERAYSEFHAQLFTLCRQLRPRLGKASLDRRIHLLTAFIEGMTVVLGNDEGDAHLKKEFKKQAFNILQR